MPVVKRKRLNSTFKVLADNGGAIPARWLRSTKKLGPARSTKKPGSSLSNWKPPRPLPPPPGPLKSVRAIIAAIGGDEGNGPIAALTGRKTQHVTNWKNTGRLPKDTFLVVSAKLAELGYRASPKLWGIAEP